MKIGIMQPYFFPYYGYFNLIDQVDKFIILDDVQFNRRGWVHRNKLYNYNNELSWLTLPLTKKPRNTTLIKDIEFVPNIYDEFSKQLLKFPKFQKMDCSKNSILNCMLNFEKIAIDYLIDNIVNVLEKLKIKSSLIISSEININKQDDYQINIINIVKKLGGNHYINLPGGVHLYDKKKFDDHKIKLSFINEDNRKYSILENLL